MSMKSISQTMTKIVMVPWTQRKTERNSRRDLSGTVVMKTRCLKDVKLDSIFLEESSRKDVE
jgi:hypothetical protein